MCPRFPYPLEKGDKLRIFHQLRYLGQKHEVHLIALSDQEIIPDHRAKLERIVTHVTILRLKSIRRYWSLFKSGLNTTPFQVSYYYDKFIAKKIEKIAHEFQPDHIYCQLTRMSEYAKNLPYPKTLDYMDAFGVGMERRAEVVKGVSSMIYKMEANRMKQYERAIYKQFDHHTVISEQDNIQISPQRISVIPNGIDTEYFSPLDLPKKYDIGFVGNMGYAPNIDAAEYLINRIKPLIGGETQWVIAGARPNKRVKLLGNSNVTITGWMDDVRSAYAESKIFVAPLWLGTGQQNKILEAMAMGIPCVTSSSVNNAIGAENGKEILVADSENEFASSINLLLNDSTLYEDMKKNALTFVRTNFSWKHTVEKLEEIFEGK